MENVTGKKPVWKRWWFWVLAVFILIVIAASGSDGSKSKDAAVEAIQPIVNAPHLLSGTIDEARKELGTPNDGNLTEPNKNQLALGTKEWTNEFTVGEYTVLLDFNLASREVTGFFIAPVHAEVDGEGNRDWQTMAKLANLSEDATTYTVKPVHSQKDPTYFTGVSADE